MSADYRVSTGCALYTVEMNIRFLHEVSRGDTLTARTVLASHDSKRVRVSTTIIGTGGEPVATGDSLYLHVDTAKGGVVEFPPDRADVLQQVQHAHSATPDR
jgi:acyl-CoA thioesterase FadM